MSDDTNQKWHRLPNSEGTVPVLYCSPYQAKLSLRPEKWIPEIQQNVDLLQRQRQSYQNLFTNRLSCLCLS